MANILEPIKQY